MRGRGELHPAPGRRCSWRRRPAPVVTRQRRALLTSHTFAPARHRVRDPTTGHTARPPRSARHGFPARRPVRRRARRSRPSTSRPASRWVISSVVRPSVASTRSAVERVGGRRVEVLARLVEDEHREVGEQGAGHRQALALAARQPGPCSPTSVSRPARQRRRPSRAAGPGRARCAGSSSVASRRARRRFSRSVVSKTWASWARPGRRPGGRRRRRGSPSSTPSRATDPPGRARTAAGPPAKVDLPAPLGPTMADPPARRQVEVDPVERPRPVRARTGPARPGPAGGAAAAATAAGRRRLGHRAGVSRTAKTRPAERRTRRGPAWPPAGRRTSSKAASGVEHDHGQEHAVEPAASARPEPRRTSAVHTARPVSSVVRPVPTPVVVRRGRGDAGELGVARRRSEPAGRRSRRRRPGRVPPRADRPRRRVSSPRAGACRASDRRASRSVSHGTTVAASSRATAERQARRPAAATRGPPRSLPRRRPRWRTAGSRAA